MTVKTGQAIAGQFNTLASTGALVDADSTPTGTLIVASVNNGATVTVAKISTGVYSWSVTLPSLTAGQVVQIRIAATIGAIAAGGIVWVDIADTKLASDLNDIAAGALMGLADGAITAAKIAADAITSAKYDESTAFPVKSADAGATQIARVGADSDTLETLSDQIDNTVKHIVWLVRKIVYLIF